MNGSSSPKRSIFTAASATPAMTDACGSRIHSAAAATAATGPATRRANTNSTPAVARPAMAAATRAAPVPWASRTAGARPIR
jgi:hypothetical protein